MKNEHNIASGDLERLRTEHFVATQKLASIEKEHDQEVQSYKEEIEDLHSKIVNLEKRLEEAKEAIAGETLSNSDEYKLDNGISPEDLGIGELPPPGIDLNDLRDPRRGSSSSRMSGFMNREKRVSFGSNAGQSEFKNQLIKDLQNKELIDRNADLQQQVDDLKLANQKMKAEIDQITLKMKEESRQIDLLKKKVETKDQELESFRKKTLEDTDKFTYALNEVNEELDNRDEQIKKLKRQIRSMQTQGTAGSPLSPIKS